MKNLTRLSVIFISLAAAIVLFTVSCSSPAPQPVAAGLPATADTQTAIPASLELSSLTINPAESNAGVQIMITARVANTSATPSNYTPKLRIDSISQAALPAFLFLKDTTIDPGATQQMSFLVTTDVPGKYKATWGQLTGDFVVNNAAEAAGQAAALLAPDFSGIDVVTGQKISLSQFKGTPVLFNFVNYGCSPSVNNVVSQQLLAIKELKAQRNDFVPVSVFCGCCPPETLRAFAKQNGLDWPWLLDSDNSIARKYIRYVGKYGYPALVFIDQDQYIRDSAGYLGTAELSSKLDQIIGKSG